MKFIPLIFFLITTFASAQQSLHFAPTTWSNQFSSQPAPVAPKVLTKSTASQIIGPAIEYRIPKVAAKLAEVVALIPKKILLNLHN